MTKEYEYEVCEVPTGATTRYSNIADAIAACKQLDGFAYVWDRISRYAVYRNWGTRETTLRLTS